MSAPIRRASLRATRCALLAAETLGRVRMGRAGSPAAELQNAAATALDLHDVRVHLHGAFMREPCVVVANHRSWLDTMVLLALVRATPLAKAEVAGWPVVGPLVKQLGGVFVRRGDTMSGALALRSCRRALEQGVSVLGFPEGTASRRVVLPFQRGLFGLARHARVPVVPVSLQWRHPQAAWVGDDAFVPHWLSLCDSGPLHVDVRVLEPIVAHGGSTALAMQARRAISFSLSSAELA